MLLTTTAHPTALAEAGTSYSQIAVKIGNNFIELEINNAVEIIFPCVYPSSQRAPHRTLKCRPPVSAAHNTRKKRYCRISGEPPRRSLMGSWSGSGVKRRPRREVWETGRRSAGVGGGRV
jgi:hypothetical protein